MRVFTHAKIYVCGWSRRNVFECEIRAICARERVDLIDRRHLCTSR